MSSPRRGLTVVEVRLAKDPEGEVRVLLQLPDSFVLLWADDARAVALAMLAACDEVEGRKDRAP